MAYLVIKELKAPTKISKNFFVFDLMFVFVFIAISIVFKDLVYGELQIPYFIFNALVALKLVSKSKSNPGKRFYQAIFLWSKKDSSLFYQITNLSKDKIRREMQHALEEAKKDYR